MWTDVVDLQDFYGTRLGAVAAHVIRGNIRDHWRDVRGKTVLGLGYTTPYLTQFEDEADRVMAFMPASQGVCHWPKGGPGKTSLVDETMLPLPDYSVDRVLLVHGLESSEYLRDMLREIWRVLTGDGRLLIVTPNRRGIWARIDKTPFGWGHPFSRSQIAQLLDDTLFVPMSTKRSLYVPPSQRATILQAAPAWERIGRRFFPTFAGVLTVEAGKQLYIPSTRKRASGIRRPGLANVPNVFQKDSPLREAIEEG
ncbi:class I SAM-dependent methyltransferase [Kiloniella laminariae]|uniref:class I SAM-dependent methyltransferase n=1 Tax=Kiloniella laminariae TaxID=454162 RepID=UPI0003713114|nr:methyltransferase domain-containing protein [Kiloniella laminariae]